MEAGPSFFHLAGVCFPIPSNNSRFLSLYVAQAVPYSQSWRTIWGKGVGGCHLWLDWAAEKSIQRHFQSFQRNQALGEISKYWSFEPGFQTSCFNSIHNKVFLSSYLKHIEKNTPKCEGQSLFLPHFQHHRDPCRAPTLHQTPGYHWHFW